MAQTPISASATITSSTPTTLYTVPSGATAVVKSVIGTSVIGGSNLTLNKVSGGTLYPVTVDASSSPTQATGGTAAKSNNLLVSPITLTAGEYLSVSTSTASAYKFASKYSSTFTITNVFYLNSTWIAIGNNPANGKGVVLTSSNGTTWTQQTFNPATTLNDMLFDGTTYVAVGTSPGEVYTSTNLTSWTTRTTPNAFSLNAIAWNGTYYVAVGTAGGYITTTNPTSTWTGYTLPNSLTTTINSVIWANSTWVFGLASAAAAVSTSSNPTSVTTPYSINAGTGTGFVAQFGDSTYSYAYTQSKVYRSSDGGANWTLLGNPTARAYNFYARSSSYYMFYISSGGTANWSSSGSTWNDSSIISNAWGVFSSPFEYYIVFVNSTRTGGTFAGDQNAGKGYPTFSTGTNVILTGQPTTNASRQVFFYRDSGSTIIGSGHIDLGSTTYSDNGSSGLTLADVGTPYISYYNGTSWFTITSSYKILKKTNYNGSTITDTGNVTPSLSFSNVASQGSTIVGISGASIYTSTNNGVSWTTISTGGNSVSSGNQSIRWNTATSQFNILFSNGLVWVSSDGLTWTFPLYNLRYAATINSQNLYQTASDLYTSTTPATSFTLLTTEDVNAGANTKNMAYIGGTYYFIRAGSVVTSTDLATFTATSVNSTALNNISYTSALGCATDGTNLLLSNNAAASSAMAYETSVSSTLSNAVVSAGIVEIS